MPQVIIVIVLAIVLSLIAIISNAMSRMSKPENHPQDFLKRGRQKNTNKLIVCAGDSHTHGVVGANYVKLLEQEFDPRGYEFVNGGINGELAWNVLQRLDAIIACQPDVVTLLVGTNDVNATISPASEADYRKRQHIPEKPTLAWYRKNIEQIIDRLQSETSAQIALIDLPPLGEDLDSEINAKITRYNNELRMIAEEKQVSYLALNSKLLALIPPDHTPPPYTGDITLILKSGLKNTILRQRWDRISAENGFKVLTDHIHMNDTSAGILAGLITDFLNNSRA